MRIPLAEVHEDMWLDLKADRYADPDNADPAFVDPLVVWSAQLGPPTTSAELAVSKVKYLGPVASEDADNRGISVTVSTGDGAPTSLLYFPDDQHEVAVSDTVDEDSDEEDEGF